MSHFRKIAHLGPATRSAKKTEHCRRMGEKGRAVVEANRAERRNAEFVASLGWPTYREERPPDREDGELDTVEDRIWRTMQAVGQSSDPGQFTCFT